MGRVAFTPEVDTAYKTKQLWQFVIRVKEQRKKSLREINKLSYALEIIAPLSKTLDQAKAALDQATQHYESLKPMAAAIREDWLHAKMKTPGITDKEAKDIARLLRVEKQREAFRRIRHLKGIKRSNSVSKVEVPVVDEAGQATTEVREDQAGVEAGLRECLCDRFTLTHDTPPMQEPLRSELGLLGNTEAAKQILEGTYECPDGVDEYT